MSARAAALPPAARAAMAEAARWRLASVLLGRPRPATPGLVRGLGAEVDDAVLRRVVRESDDCEESAYLRLLGPGGVVSPREVAYRPMAEPGRLLAELCGTYRAFAYAPRTEDPPDHVAVEAGFVGWLRLKEAYAVSCADETRAETARAAIRLVVAEHLTGFADRLAAALERAASGTTWATTAAWIVDAAGIRGADDPLRVVAEPPCRAEAGSGAEDGPFGICGA